MARFIIEKRIVNPEQMKFFDAEVIHSVRSYQKTGSGFLPASTEKVLL